ncbi:calcium-binding protein [Tropicibacter oceani]|uniref:Calcium-binding protein n=1 Tax=Tropicibacter oceani TaxID=3058420 RepID=A0ABY8QJ01_9RHOB|nr:calcium-binding protein [Tropicibacter oceani]WGW03991.1 calcium-binding protein [Tropicibacter oceani]
MFFLAGLMGMMVLGSFAFVSTPFVEEDEAVEDDLQDATTGEAEEDPDAEVGEGTGIMDFAAASEEAAANQEAAAPVHQTMTSDIGMSPQGEAYDIEQDVAGGAMQSLFGQMGLINMPGLIEEGSDGDDSMTGTDATDLLGGGDGNDLIDSGASDDELQGGDGEDTLLGGSENDSLHGGAGADVMFGGDGQDEMFGHDGDDQMSGDAGDDELWGGLGDDRMDGGDGADALLGREGADTLDGGLGEDTLFGGWDNDLLIGVERDADGLDVDDADYLNGGDGDDTIAIGTGDIVTGGEGADVLVLGDWIADKAAQLMDFDASEDQIVVVYDDSNEEDDPELELRVSADDPELSEIVVNGVVLGTLATVGAPSVDAIVLVGESAAGALSFG